MDLVELSTISTIAVFKQLKLWKLSANLFTSLEVSVIGRAAVAYSHFPAEDGGRGRGSWAPGACTPASVPAPPLLAAAAGGGPLGPYEEGQHLVPFPLPEPNLGEDDEDKDLEPGPSGTSKASAQISGQSDTDITAEFLQPLLTPDNVANLVSSGGPSPRGREEGSPSPARLRCTPFTAAGCPRPEAPLCSQRGRCGPRGRLPWAGPPGPCCGHSAASRCPALGGQSSHPNPHSLPPFDGAGGMLPGEPSRGLCAEWCEVSTGGREGPHFPRILRHPSQRERLVWVDWRGRVSRQPPDCSRTRASLGRSAPLGGTHWVAVAPGLEGARALVVA